MTPAIDPATFWDLFAEALAGVDPAATQPPPDGRVGAVLVLLEDTDAGPQLVLTRRRADLRSHPGQVSFPGGRLDPDETIEEAALREATEEVGLEPDSVDLIGRGPTFYIPPSKFWVVPVAARWARPHALRPNPWEVDEILHVPLAHLLDQERWRHVPLSLRGSTWAWQLDDDLLWGATAIICALMLDVAVPDWSGGRGPEDLPEELAVKPWESAPLVVARPRLGDELPTIDRSQIPFVTAAQMRDVDRRCAEEGLALTSLVEQAGRGVAHAARRLAEGALDACRVTVAAGHGGNGAGGLAAARLLHAAGADVRLVLTGRPSLPWQVDLLAAAGVPVVRAHEEHPTGDVGDIVIDAMVGIGGSPPLRDVPARVAEWLRQYDTPVIAVDMPSGLSPDEGLSGMAMTVDVTVALGLPKVGLETAIVQPFIGDLYVADLGVPDHVWRAVGVEPPHAVFRSGPLVRLVVNGGGPTDAGTPDQGEQPAV